MHKGLSLQGRSCSLTAHVPAGSMEESSPLFQASNCREEAIPALQTVSQARSLQSRGTSVHHPAHGHLRAFVCGAGSKERCPSPGDVPEEGLLVGGTGEDLRPAFPGQRAPLMPIPTMVNLPSPPVLGSSARQKRSETNCTMIRDELGVHRGSARVRRGVRGSSVPLEGRTLAMQRDFQGEICPPSRREHSKPYSWGGGWSLPVPTSQSRSPWGTWGLDRPQNQWASSPTQTADPQRSPGLRFH